MRITKFVHIALSIFTVCCGIIAVTGSSAYGQLWQEFAVGPDTKSLCGEDNRVASSDPRVARIMPAGCTAFLVSNGAILTAGHCESARMERLEFNVPPSSCFGEPLIPSTEDLYLIHFGSIVQVANGEGDDWALFSVTETDLDIPLSRRGFFRMSRDYNPSLVQVTGYGDDRTPPGCTDDLNSDNLTQQTHQGRFIRESVQGPSDVYIEYSVDTEGASSGSPVIIWGTDVAIGIHTTGGCAGQTHGNIGTSFENDALENAIQTFPGNDVVYVDKDHPVVLEDGTIFRPYDTMAEGVASVVPGGMISIVQGSYNEQITIDKAMTVVAPVGAGTIGR